MDQAAEEIAPLDLGNDLNRLDVALLLRCSKVKAAVRSRGVVMADVARKNSVEMTETEDKSPVEGFMTQRLHGALGKGVVISLQLQTVLSVRKGSPSPIPSIP